MGRPYSIARALICRRKSGDRRYSSNREASNRFLCPAVRDFRSTGDILKPIGFLTTDRGRQFNQISSGTTQMTTSNCSSRLERVTILSGVGIHDAIRAFARISLASTFREPHHQLFALQWDRMATPSGTQLRSLGNGGQSRLLWLSLRLYCGRLRA